jgi:hypothetical protein
MDVYHRVLAKLYEITGGKDTQDVEFRDLLKREGFFPSIEDIKKHLSGESWITETSRTNVVRITHWGVAEAKKAQTSTPDGALEARRNANKLKEKARDFMIAAEEYAGAPSDESLKGLEKNFKELEASMARLSGVS